MQASDHRSTSRVLDVLEQLAARKEGLTLTELSGLLQAPKSSLFPIIHTMENRGFLMSDSNGRYSIGPKSYLTGLSYENPITMHGLIQDKMRKIVDQCQETCHLAILSGSDILYIAKIESPLPISLRSRKGGRLPAYCTGLGKALLYPLTLEQLKDLYPNGLSKHTANTITDLTLLHEELQTVSSTGFAYEHSEATEGVECVAVPLRRSGKVLASMSICIPCFRSTPEKLEEIKLLLKEAQQELELRFEEYQVENNLFLL